MPATMIIHEDAQKIATAIDWFKQSGHGGAQQGVVAEFKTEEVRPISMKYRTHTHLPQ